MNAEDVLEVEPTEEAKALYVFDPEEWILRVDHRTKDRMKINFKLTQEQSQAYMAFQKDVKPDHISENEFLKSIFFTGLSTLQENLVRAAELAMQSDEVDIEALAEEVAAEEAADETE